MMSCIPDCLCRLRLNQHYLLKCSSVYQARMQNNYIFLHRKVKTFEFVAAVAQKLSFCETMSGLVGYFKNKMTHFVKFRGNLCRLAYSETNFDHSFVYVYISVL